MPTKVSINYSTASIQIKQCVSNQCNLQMLFQILNNAMHKLKSRTTAALDVLYMCVCVYYVYMSLYMCTMCVQATDSLETEL